MLPRPALLVATLVLVAGIPIASRAAEPVRAEALFATFVELLRHRHHPVATGIFAADMQVHLVNDGPVTFLLEL